MQLNKGRLISLCIIILKLAFTPFNNIHPQYSPRSIAENIWVCIFDMSLNRPTTLFVFSIFSKPG